MPSTQSWPQPGMGQEPSDKNPVDGENQVERQELWPPWEQVWQKENNPDVAIVGLFSCSF